MTYIKTPPNLPTASKSIGTLTPPASLAAGQRMPCGSITHADLTVNGSGQLVLDANKTFIIWGSPLIEDNSSPYTGTCTCQFYDVTNSVYIGRTWGGSAGITAGVTHQRSSFSRCVIYTSVQTTIEFRITAIWGNLDTINPASASAHWGTHAPYVGSQYYAVLSF